MLPELVAAHTLLGRHSLEQGDYETCFGHFKKGLQTAKTIAGTIDDGNDRARFQQQRLMVYLVARIKELGGRFGQKTPSA